ncbi:12375_t:CDS:2 [Entrophospora sp. SA101]|nr:12375_t:CDS:2 [Entrophospora sp. SA101]
MTIDVDTVGSSKLVATTATTTAPSTQNKRKLVAAATTTTAPPTPNERKLVTMDVDTVGSSKLVATTTTTTAPSTPNKRKSKKPKSQVTMDIDPPEPVASNTLPIQSQEIMDVDTTEPSKSLSKEEKRVIVDLGDADIPDGEKDAVVSDSIDETIFKRMNPISFLNLLYYRTRSQKNQRRPYYHWEIDEDRLWNCKLNYLDKTWVSCKSKDRRSAKFNVASQATLEIYSNTPDVSNEIKKILLRMTENHIVLF